MLFGVRQQQNKNTCRTASRKNQTTYLRNCLRKTVANASAETNLFRNFVTKTSDSDKKSYSSLANIEENLLSILIVGDITFFICVIYIYSGYRNGSLENSMNHQTIHR